MTVESDLLVILGALFMLNERSLDFYSIFSTGSLGAKEHCGPLRILARTRNCFTDSTWFRSTPRALWSAPRAHRISCLRLRNPCRGLRVRECPRDFRAPVELHHGHVTGPSYITMACSWDSSSSSRSSLDLLGRNEPLRVSAQPGLQEFVPLPRGAVPQHCAP
jgi:hypothetical protein